MNFWVKGLGSKVVLEFAFDVTYSTLVLREATMKMRYTALVLAYVINLQPTGGVAGEFAQSCWQSPSAIRPSFQKPPDISVDPAVGLD